MASCSSMVWPRVAARSLLRGKLPSLAGFGGACRIFSAFPDPYKTLGIQRDAAEADIKKAYKEQALKWHPDRNPEEQQESAQKRFSEAASAYEVLSDPQKKQEYDQFGRVGGPGNPAGGQPGNPADAERMFRAMFGQGGMEQIMQQFRRQQQEAMEMQRQQLEEMKRKQGLHADMEVHIRREPERIHRASRESGIDAEYDERRAGYAGKMGTIVKCDHRDQSIKLRVMVSPGRADEVWYGADAVWDPDALQPETQVRISADVPLIHEASRRAGIGADNDERRERCAGKLGAITKIDLSDKSVKVRVLVGARSAEELWFGFSAFEPIPRLPETSIQPPAPEEGPRTGCGGGGGPFPPGAGSPFPGGQGSPFPGAGGPFAGAGGPFPGAGGPSPGGGAGPRGRDAGGGFH